MGIFELHKETVFAAASELFDGGTHRPRVTAEHLIGVAA